MKPQTLEVFADISVESIKKETEELIAAVGFAVDSSDFRDCATTCRNIADVAEALENLYMTAADEFDRMEINDIADENDD